MSEEPQHPLTHLCPACGQPVELPSEFTGAPLQCAACGEQFFIDDEEEPEEIATADEQERLDNLRITRITGLRRANYRSRSHAIIAAIVCLVGAIQSCVLAVREFRMAGGWSLIAIYLLIAMLAVLGMIFFARRALALHREITRPPADSRIPESTSSAPPS